MSVRVKQGGPKVKTAAALAPPIVSKSSSAYKVTRAVPRSAYPAAAWPDESGLQQELRERAASEVFDGPLIAVLVPVLSRPLRAAPLAESFRRATSEADAVLYFVAQTSDTAEVEAIRRTGYKPILVGDIDRSWAKKINRGYESTREPWLLLGADDLAFHSGWVDQLREALRTHPGVIGTNDLCNPSTRTGESSTHPLVRRVYADVMGTVDERRRATHEGYVHNFPDTELVATAKRRGLYLHRADCVIEHLHPMAGKAVSDDVYRLGQQSFCLDEALFQQRSRTLGF